jgi:replicative DNA helicase
MEELLQHRVPYSETAEQGILGSMLIDANCIPDVIQKVRSTDFYLEQNRNIFETIESMMSFGKNVDPITVLDEMKKQGTYRENLEGYLKELILVTPTAANVLEYCKIVQDNALERQLLEVADKIRETVDKGSGTADAMLEGAERMIYALRQGRTVGGLIPVRNIVETVYSNINNLAMGQTIMPGVMSGFVDIDRKTLGLNNGELIIIAARPGMGKTSIALNIALNVAQESKKEVAIFSLEMTREQLVTRLLSSESAIGAQKLMTGKLDNEEWSQLYTATTSLMQTNIYIDDNSTLTVADMNAQCRRMNNLGLVVIDYLQLMQGSGSGRSYNNENRTQVVSDMSRMLKVMAKELNVPVICLSQLSRATESRKKEERRPMLSDLRESGSIEQDADVVIGLYREGYYETDVQNLNKSEAIILKNRKGETGTVELLWNPECTKFENYDSRHEEE